MKTNRSLLVTIGTILVSIFLFIPTSCTSTNSSGIFEQMLSVIPDTENNRSWITINDYAQIREQFKKDAPSIDATTDEQITYFNSLISVSLDGMKQTLSLAAPFGFVNNNSAFLKYSLESLQNLGIGYWSINQEVAAGRPPSNISIIKGQFEPQNIQQALSVNAKDNPPSTEKYNENIIYSWGEDFEFNLAKRFAPPAYDTLGRGGRFVFQSDYAFRTNETPGIKLILDTQKGEQAPLADVSDYKLMANELSSHGALSALLTNQTQSVDFIREILTVTEDFTVGNIDNYLAQGPILLPYKTMALGVAKDEEGIFALIILVHNDKQTADDNLTLLKQRVEETNSAYTNESWMSTFKITNISIVRHGKVLIAKLYGESIIRNWQQWYYRHDPLVLHK